ncbi:MAG: hypothetical protein GY856_08450 [bacterium]|nr:hypothetical protein [bacterium]
MRSIESRNRRFTTCLALGLFLALGGLLATLAAAEPGSVPLDRQVRVMALVIDELLGPRSHGLRRPGAATRSLTLEEFGALFIVEASPEAELLQFQATKTVYRSSEDGERMGEAELAELGQKVEQMREESERVQKECLADIRSKLIDVILDYGPTLTALRDDHWVVVAAYPECVVSLHQADGSALILQVRMSDLRQFRDGSLSREATIAKIKIEQR